jgi:hypothetical protein
MAGHSKWSEIERCKGLTESRDRAHRELSVRVLSRSLI